MKIFISILILMLSLVSYSQVSRPSTIYLKSGEVIKDVKGVYNNKYFKYNKKVGQKYTKIKFELIDSVLLTKKSGNIIQIIRLPINGKEKSQVVERILSGKLELYQNFNEGYYLGHYSYFIREKGQEKLTLIDDVDNKKKMYPLIKNCKHLIEKIENKEFDMFHDLIKVVATYNLTCSINKD